jgi:predicted TPR repeat methyltransferase
MGNMLDSIGKATAAEQSFRQAIKIEPGYADAYLNLGRLCMMRKDLEQAESLFRQVMDLDPDNQSAQHMIAAITGAPRDRAPAGYVESLFDQYAGYFEPHLAGLDYKIPEFMAGVLGGQLADSKDRLDVLDLGCGTGLCGQYFRPFAATLTGVDLSEKMLGQASSAGHYDQLFKGDVCEIRHLVEGPFDLVVAADVFVYIGELVDVFTNVWQLLRPKGLFLFSIEVNRSDQDYVLMQTGRYSQSSAYIHRLAADASMTPLVEEDVMVRKKRDQSVDGAVFMLQKRITVQCDEP